MNRLVTALWRVALAAAAVVLLCSAQVSAAGPDVTNVPSAAIVGTIHVRGCVLDPATIELQAVPLQLGAPDFRPGVAGPTLHERQARIVRTEDPHRFSFSIEGVHPRTPYDLSLFVPPSPVCPAVFWKGPISGLAIAGGPPVEIEGLAATTRVEILEQGTDDWVGIDALDFTDPAVSTRRFRWRTDLPGVTGGELQLSTERFDGLEATSGCDEPDGGVFFRKVVRGTQGDWLSIDAIDFNQLLHRQRGPADDDPRGTGFDVGTLTQLAAGAPIYARVVPATADGPLCDPETSGVPGWVVLAKVPGGAPVLPAPPPAPPIIEPGDGHQYVPPYTAIGTAGENRPTYGEVAYKVIADHVLPTYEQCTEHVGQLQIPVGMLADPFGCMIVLAGWRPGGSTLSAGEWFFYAPSSGGGGSDFLDPFVEIGQALVTGVGGVFAPAVDWVSGLYEDAKAFVQELAMDVLLTIPGVGDVCAAHKDICEQAVKTGLTVAMAAAGMPPSIPNWEELKQQGVDYLASKVGDEITASVPPPANEVAKEKLKELAQEAIDQMTKERGLDPGDPRVDWLVPYLGADPASWVVSVKKHGDDPLPPNIFLDVASNDLYRNAAIPLPERFTSDVLRIPVVLAPSLDGIPAPLCQTDFFHQTTCVPLPPIFTKPSCFGTIGVGQKTSVVPYDCKYASHPAIYYRDAWTNLRFRPTDCLLERALSVKRELMFDGLLPSGVETTIVPGISFPVAARVRPPLPLTWNGPFGFAC